MAKGSGIGAFRRHTHPVIWFRSVIIYAVNGTWPYGPPRWGHRRTRADWAGADAPWFERGSAFAAAVTQGRDVDWVPFEWPGDNTFAARDTARADLRERLQASLASGDEPLAILAHSHGGTVAVAAVAQLSAEHRARIVGIVTMGTPFATLKYGVSSSLAVAQALLDSAAKASPFVVGLSAAIVWALGSGHLFIHTVALATAAWTAALVMLALGLPGRIARRSGPRAAAFDLFEKAPALDVPLVALRVSGDEAGLAIAAAQALRLVAVAALRILPGWMVGDVPRAGSDKSRGTRIALGLSCVAALLPLLLRYREALTGAARLDVAGVALAVLAVVAAWAEASAWLFALAMFGLMLLSWLAAASVRFLAGTTGPEALDLIAQVECEPVPAGGRAVVETLALENAEERRFVDVWALRHSFHQLPSVRRRVSEAIADWLTPPQDETRALVEGGRARALVFARWLDAHDDVLRAGGPASRQTAQRLARQAHEAAGPVAAFQLMQQLETRLPEGDRPVLGQMAIDIQFAVIAADVDAVGRKLDEV